MPPNGRTKYKLSCFPVPRIPSHSWASGILPHSTLLVTSDFGVDEHLLWVRVTEKQRKHHGTRRIMHHASYAYPLPRPRMGACHQRQRYTPCSRFGSTFHPRQGSSRTAHGVLLSTFRRAPPVHSHHVSMGQCSARKSRHLGISASTRTQTTTYPDCECTTISYKGLGRSGGGDLPRRRCGRDRRRNVAAPAACRERARKPRLEGR